MEKFLFIPEINSLDKKPFELILSGITYPDPAYKMYRKCSELYVIEYVEEGEGTVICNGTGYHIEKGDTYILPQGFEQRYYSDKRNPWKKKWMNITGPLCESLLEMYGINGTVRFPQSHTGDLFDELFTLCAERTRDSDINAVAAIIFHRIVQRLSEVSEKKSVGTAQKVKLFIDRNIYGKINAETVAEKFGFSVSQLGRLFKQEYGVTVYSYILEQKLNTAEKLLKNSTVPISKIADMLNFTDEHYFCNIFKRKRGTTPGKFRR